jgi:hypothetical protein
MVKKSDVGDATKDDSISAAKVVSVSSKAIRRKKVSTLMTFNDFRTAKIRS